MLFFFIPIGTNAPLYHLPFGTGGLILLNIVVLVLQMMFPEAAEAFELQFGVINPLQWVTAMLMHGGIGHLIGNLIGLGLFGWVIEGKVGWWRFLIICFAIGISANAFTQIVMIWASAGSALGFSGVVYGLIAMAMIWAPENEVQVAFAGILLFRPFWHVFDVTLSTLGFVMIGLEFIVAAFTGFVLSSEVLHLIGSVPGFTIAYLMIRWRRVDCDGYDLISTLKGKRGERVLTVADEKAEQVQRDEAKLEAQRNMEMGLNMVQKYIDTGHYDLALNRFGMLKKQNHSLVMTEPQFVKIIKAYDADEATKQKNEPLLKAYLASYDRYRIPFTLMLARIHILLQDRPRQGIKVLKTLDWHELNTSQKDFVRRLLERAKAMIADGVLEIDE